MALFPWEDAGERGLEIGGLFFPLLLLVILEYTLPSFPSERTSVLARPKQT